MSYSTFYMKGWELSTLVSKISESTVTNKVGYSCPFFFISWTVLFHLLVVLQYVCVLFSLHPWTRGGNLKKAVFKKS